MPTPFDSRRRPPGRRLSSGLSRAAADEREKFAQVLRPARVEAGTDLAGVPTATPRGGAGGGPAPRGVPDPTPPGGGGPPPPPRRPPTPRAGARRPSATARGGWTAAACA